MKETLLNEIQEDTCPVVAELASRYADKINDFNELGKAVSGFLHASWVLKGKINEKKALAFVEDIDGVVLGLDLLQLKKEGIITEKEIVNINKFNQSNAVKNFTINGKSFNLSPNLSMQQINNKKSDKSF